MKPPSPFFSGIVISWPASNPLVQSVEVFSIAQHLVAADERAVVVADEAALEQVRLGEHLEAVADAEHGHAAVRGIHDLGHDRAERGDRAAAQVVAVAEPAGQDERVDALEVVRAVPECDGLGAREPHGALRVAVVERAGEGDDADAHAGPPQWVSPAGAT